MAGGYVRYILILRFHSFLSLFASSTAFSAFADDGGAGVGGVGAPQAGGRKLTKRFAKSESDAVWL